MKIGIDLDLRQNELQNGVFQNLLAAPENPKLGQFYFDTTLGKYGVYEGVVGEEHWVYYATVDDLRDALDQLGTMAYEDKNDYYTKQDIVDHFWSNNDKTLATGHFKTETAGTNGTAVLWNENSGGGAQFINKDGTESFVGVNDGSIASGDKKLRLDNPWDFDSALGLVNYTMMDSKGMFASTSSNMWIRLMCKCNFFTCNRFLYYTNLVA